MISMVSAQRPRLNNMGDTENKRANGYTERTASPLTRTRLSQKMQEHPMSRPGEYHKRQAKAIQRRRYTAAERLQRDRRQAQQAAEALHQALEDLGLPENLLAEIEGRLRSQQKLLSKIVGVMCPPLFGCRTNSELCRVRGWEKNLPARLLGALPKRSWIRRLRRLGLEVLVPLWRSAAGLGARDQGRRISVC
jgi:hypothetical protein